MISAGKIDRFSPLGQRWFGGERRIAERFCHVLAGIRDRCLKLAELSLGKAALAGAMPGVGRRAYIRQKVELRLFDLALPLSSRAYYKQQIGH